MRGKPIRSPHERSFTITGARLVSGKRMAEATHRWMERNEQGFREIYGFVKQLQRTGQKGRVRDRVAVFCQERGIEVGDGEYTFANAYWAGIARYLVLADPTLLYAPIEFRDSDIGCHGLYPVSWLEIGGAA